MLFALFPGVNPGPWVEDLGKGFGITAENGGLLSISMGQGQEKLAEALLARSAEEGKWIMLENVHLMQSWLHKLEHTLEVISCDAHESFRCFLTGEGSFAMPESLLQSCIKVANEAPSDLKSNLRHSWALFPDKRISECDKPKQFRRYC
jgi:dynein heavy chain